MGDPFVFCGRLSTDPPEMFTSSSPDMAKGPHRCDYIKNPGMRRVDSLGGPGVITRPVPCESQESRVSS